ncbi:MULTISPECIES: LysR family transcriptional regulator [Hyphobacterium]|uniref:LysR family transcriptional regulator n=1 Tax=Hyphobacterium vulgare TaxID=1736751 RepID=A0ABV6ZXP9_9PROT
MLNLRTARLFAACADHGTLTAAATALNVSQPAASKTLGQIEAALGGALFERAGRKLVLTRLGEAMLPRARSLLQQAADLEAEARRWRRGEAGALTLGTGPAIAYQLLPETVGRFLQSHSGVRLTVRAGAAAELIELVARGQIDLAAAHVGNVAPDPGLVVRRLPAQRMAAAVRSGHPVLSGGALTDYPVAGATLPEALRREPLAWGAVPAGVVCDDYTLLARAALVTDHILIGPEPVVRHASVVHGLIVLDVPVSDRPVEPALIYRKSAPRSAARDALCACFEAVAREGDQHNSPTRFSAAVMPDSENS